MVNLLNLQTTTGAVHWRNIQKLSEEENQEIVSCTSFLHDNVTIKHRVYCLINGIKAVPCCWCGNELQYSHGKYGKNCSTACSANNPIVQQKKKKTARANYGVDNPSSSAIVKNKIKTTCQEKYGTDNPASNIEIRQKISNGVKAAHDTNAEEIQRKRRNTTLKHYGVDHVSKSKKVSNKVRSTNRERYGYDYAWQSELTKAAIRQTNLDRYGVENVSQAPDTIQKIKQTKKDRYGNETYNNRDKARTTMVDRFGVSYAMQRPDIKQKVIEACIDRYGTDHPVQHPDIKQKVIETYNKMYNIDHYSQLAMLRNGSLSILKSAERLEELVKKHGTVLSAAELSIDLTTLHRYLRKYNLDYLISTQRSSHEIHVAAWLDEYNIKYIQNDRSVIAPYELDFYLPAYNIAIEINGIYWHSTASPAQRDKSYHFKKWNMCREIGISMYSYTDAMVVNNPEQIKTKIRYLTMQNRIVIGARTCKIDTVFINDEFKLLNERHIQGKLQSRDGSLGAYYNNNLVAVINWKKRKNYIEVTRYCCDTKASYPGLFSKMTKAMVIETGYVGDIVSFSNNDHSNGNVYRQSGFVIDNILGPAYWYTLNFDKLENRQKYMKSKIAKRFGIDMTNKTEWQAMQELEYARYYDSGKVKWRKHTDDIIK